MPLDDGLFDGSGAIIGLPWDCMGPGSKSWGTVESNRSTHGFLLLLTSMALVSTTA